MDRILRQFLAVAETGSVTLAAQRLNVTQPTISVNLLKLEELHQVPLFERGGRGMVLTQFGIILYDHVSAMSRLEAHARARIRALRSSRRQAIRFGCGFAWWAVFMRDVVAEFRADNSELSLLIDICNTNDGLRNLLSGDIAFFFGSEISHVSPRIGVGFEHLFVSGVPAPLALGLRSAIWAG